MAGEEGEQRETAELVHPHLEYPQHVVRPTDGRLGLEAVVTFRPDLNCLDQQDPSLAARIR